MLFTMHVIIIFMYTTINLIVLSSVPYKHNRFKKTEQEKAKEIEKRLKKNKKKKKQTSGILHLSSHETFVKQRYKSHTLVESWKGTIIIID